MSKLKKWQCPYCPQDSNRHWNIVVHFGRKHGSGDPGEKSDSDQAGKPLSFHPDMTNKNREYSQSHPHNNRYNGGYKTIGRGNDDFGDMIDYMYRLLTYFVCSSVNPVSSKDELKSYLETLKENGGWKEKDGWMVKRDKYGNVREVYNLCDKSFLMP